VLNALAFYIFSRNCFIKKNVLSICLCCDKRIEKLEAGEGDEWAFVDWQARMKKLDRDKQLEEFERRRLAGLLSQQESIIARQKIIQYKKDDVIKMKEEVAVQFVEVTKESYWNPLM